MSASGWLQLALFFGAVTALAVPLGAWMARVFEGRPTPLDRVLGPIERVTYRFCGIDPSSDMSWRAYAVAMLAFSGAGFVFLFLMLRFQHLLPLNPDGIGPMDSDLALNTAVSFVTNTNWQSYSGETAVSHFSQMVGLAVLNFVSAALGIAVLIALARAIQRRASDAIGNFWVDLTRTTLYVLAPLAIILALLLVSQGVPQCFSPAVTATLTQAVPDSSSTPSAQFTQQAIPLGPVASQVAIKQLGTNGGGFYGTNSAHPLENPTPFSNFLEMVSILLISAALCFTFGRMIHDPRQGLALFAVMTILFVPWLVMTALAEQDGNPALAAMGVDVAGGADHPGGNMEGKEVRTGIANSAAWATATTAASNGSVNSMHDAYTPLGSIGLFFLMHIGEVSFGGVGSGLYGLLAFAIVAVFAAGLMVGRTPEIYGKKIESFEVKMSVIAILAPSAAILLGTAMAVLLPSAKAAVSNGGPHAFSEILYCFTSQGANNGSAFAGLGTDIPFFNVAGSIAMLLGRYTPALCMLAIAGSLARKKKVPEGPGTLPTFSIQFVGWLVAVVVIVGALSFLPAITLGPVVEHLLMGAGARF